MANNAPLKSVTAAMMICIVITLVPTFSYSESPTSFTVFRNHVLHTKNAMLEHCQKRGKADLTGIKGSLEDRNVFRIACGKALNETPTPFQPWNFIADHESDTDGAWDVLGIQKNIVLNNHTPASLVIAWETRRSFPHNAPEITSNNPTAILFVKNGDIWESIWSYVDPVRDDWYEPLEYSPTEFTLKYTTPQELEAIWRGDVITGIANFDFQISDSRGIAFP